MPVVAIKLKISNFGVCGEHKIVSYMFTLTLYNSPTLTHWHCLSQTDRLVHCEGGEEL